MSEGKTIKMLVDDNDEFVGFINEDGTQTRPQFDESGLLVGIKTGDTVIPVEYKEPTAEDLERAESLKRMFELLSKLF